MLARGMLKVPESEPKVPIVPRQPADPVVGKSAGLLIFSRWELLDQMLLEIFAPVTEAMHEGTL
jgi:hypothetical protein